MTKDEFQIDTEFYTAAGKWRCTDIGTRVVVASWYAGPPFAVAEWVFDEHDLGGCSLDAKDFNVDED